MTRKENYDELLISGASVADTLAAKAESSEVDSLSTTVGEKADQDGGGTASLSNYASVDTDSASVTNDLSAGSVDTDDLQTATDDSTVNVSIDNYGGGDIGEAFNNARATHGDDNITYRFPRGVYDLTTTIDLTDMDPPESARNGVDIDLRGTHLNHKVDIGFDCTGSNYLKFWGGRITASSGTDYNAAVCFLLARNDQYPPATGHKWFGTRVVGPFSSSIVYNLNSERNQFYGCALENRDGQSLGPSGSRAVYLGTTNDDGITSKYSTIETKVTLNNCSFYGGAIHGPRAVELRQGTDSTGSQRKINETTFNEVYFEATENMCRVDLTDGVALSGLHFNDCRLSDTEPNNTFNFTAGGQSKNVEGFTVRGGFYKTASDSGGFDINMPDGITLQNSYISRDTRWMNNMGLRLGGVEDCLIAAPKGQTVIFGSDVIDTKVETNGNNTSYNAGAVRVTEYSTTQNQTRYRNTNAGEELTLDRNSIGTTGTRNLANVTPAYDGQIRRDDGTNFTTGEYAYADTSNGVWRAVSDPANLTVTY